MKRSPLKANPETQRAWQQRSRDTALDKSRRDIGKPLARTVRKRDTHKTDPPELVAAKKIVHARSLGRCEVRGEVCTGRGEHVHHRGGRGWGGCHNPELLVDSCLADHAYIHGYPGVSYLSGWLVRKAFAQRGEFIPSSLLAAR